MTPLARRSGIKIGELWPLLALLLLSAAVAWVLWPLRAASALPNPAWPAVEFEPPDRQETLLIAPTTLVPQAQVRVAPRVVLYDPGRALPHAGAAVQATLVRSDDPSRLPLARAQATTDELGTAALMLLVALALSAPLLALHVIGYTPEGGWLGALTSVIIAAGFLVAAGSWIKGLRVKGFSGALIAALAMAAVGWLITWGIVQLV